MLEHYWDRDWNSSVSHRSQFEYLGQQSLADRLIFFDDSYLQIHLGPERTARVVRDAVARGVIAFAKNLQVGGGVKIIAMQAVARGKFKRLRHGGVIGHGNLVEE